MKKQRRKKGLMESVGKIIKETVPQGEQPVSESLLSAEEVKCRICRDVGYVHPLINGKPDYSQVVTCQCRREDMEKQRTAAMLKMCQLPECSEDWTLEKFEVGPDVHKAYDSALQLAEDSDEIRWLTLLGDWDRGKTHLLVAICRRWLARGKPSRYAYVPMLLKQLRGSFEEKGEYDRLFDFFCKVPLLALDDLGVEKRTPWVMQELDTIVDYRYANRLPLVITSNLLLEELPPRIASRVQREPWCRVIEMKGSEHRLRRGTNDSSPLLHSDA